MLNLSASGISPKAVTATAISLGLAAVLTLIGTSIEGYLWQLPSVHVQDRGVDAEMAKASAEKAKAAAQMLASRAEIAKSEAEKEKARAEGKKAEAEMIKGRAELVTAQNYGAEVKTRIVEVEGTDRIINQHIVKPIDEMATLEEEIGVAEDKLHASTSVDEGVRLIAEIDQKRMRIETLKRAGGKALQNVFGMVFQSMPGLTDLYNVDSRSSAAASRPRPIIKVEP